MQSYLQLMEKVLREGDPRMDRTGVGTVSLFGEQLRFDLAAGFPLVTTKKVHLKSVIIELLWMIRGDTNTAYLKENGVSIWDEWAGEDGNLGPIYGAQWRGNYPGGTDQLQQVIDGLKRDPYSRRHLVSAWNVSLIPQMKLAPCHAFFQFYVSQEKLSCHLYQRSADIFLGVPFNIASYALLTHMVAQVVGLEVGVLVHTFGDVHLYQNHFAQAKTQLSRQPYPLPKLRLNPAIKNIDDFQLSDIEVLGYQSHGALKAPVAI